MADAFVQAQSGVNFIATTATAALSGNTATGNVIACYVWWKNITSTVVSVTDGTNTLIDSGLGSQALNGNHTGQMFYKENITGLTTPTFTVTMSTAPSEFSIAIVELSGRLSSGALDQKQWNTQNFTGTGTDFITSNTITTTTNGQAIVGMTHSEFSSINITAGTNYTLRTSGANKMFTETLTAGDQAAAGSIAATFTNADNDGWITGIMTFKAAAGAGGTTISGLGRRLQGFIYSPGG